MTDLSKLTVSLTKHGAHKISQLLRQFDANDVLNHLDGSVPGINIESAQAKKNLSADADNIVPDIWDRVKPKGNDAINGLVLIGIIFSHHSLISAMQNSSNREQFTGTITRGNQLEGKAYTNFAHILDELGFATSHNQTQVSYNLESLFKLNDFSGLVGELLQLKLTKARWDGNNSLIDEMVSLNFQDVFSVDVEYFTSWFAGNLIQPAKLEAEDVLVVGSFKFSSGHNKRKTGATERTQKANSGKVNLKHNEIQNELFEQLVDEYGDGNVGSEIDTGQRTYVDVVVKTDDYCVFYEIKTASSVKACIREAIPQLLEYAYWQELDFVVNKLIIVSELEVTEEAETYLEYLRKNFGIQFYYKQFISEKI